MALKTAVDEVRNSNKTSSHQQQKTARPIGSFSLVSIGDFRALNKHSSNSL